MDKITLAAKPRESSGKGHARSLRRSGDIPAVLYAKGQSQPIKLSYKDLAQFIKTTAGEQVVVSLQFPDGASKVALLKDYQSDPVRGSLLHADFQEISMTEKIKVGVHISIVGEPLGVKRDGGILQFGIREIEVECLPDRIPGHVAVDVSALLTGHSLHVSDLIIPEGVKVLTDPAELVATVTPPVVVAAPAAAAVEAAPAEETKEPELVKKPKAEKEKEKEKEG